MEPVTAIGLASGLITFVDFASKIVAGTYEVYNSAIGTTVENAHIDTVICDLKEVVTDLDRDLPGKSKHERALKELASKCEKAGNELLQLLERLKVGGRHSTWKSLKAAIISMRKQKKIAGLEKRLNDYRLEILMRLTLMMHDQSIIGNLQLERLENATLNLSSETASQAKAMREDIIRDITHLLDQKTTPKDTAGHSSLLEVERSLKTLSSLITTVPKENEILKLLYFDSIDFRENTIINAEDGTFEWLFEDDDRNEDVAYSSQSGRSTPANSAKDEQSSQVPEPDGHQREDQGLREEELKRRAQIRTLFMAWLNSGNDIFHISGKAGSGKSTLMKFISHHEHTMTELKKWAGQKKLVFAQFYFWKSQDTLQMSLDGLYRSILFTTLRQCPELIPKVFPIHWEQLKSSKPFITGNFINHFDLAKAFDALTTTDTFPNHRFCYFVDGLDEYEGHSLDHLRLTKSLQKWASSNDVKICASSRPYIEYEHLAVSPDQRLHLHELTSHDIHLFSRQMIEKDDNFEHIKDSYLSLVAEVVRRSEGVFLWARLAVNSLLVGMLRHDHLKTLKRKLDILPGDLNQLYDQQLNSLDEDDRERAVRMLLLTAQNPSTRPLSIVVYWWLDNLDDPEFPPRNGVRPVSWPPAIQMIDDTRLQIKSLTKGLLETTTKRFDGGLFDLGLDMHMVQFFHRTVRDFVIERLEPVLNSRKYHRVLDLETYHRLRLAELTLWDVHSRRGVWNFILSMETSLHRLFQKKLSLDMMESFKCILDVGVGPALTGVINLETFSGIITKGRRYWYNVRTLSFVHMAAYSGQLEYVLQEVDKDRTLFSNDKELSVFASAVAGNQIDLAKALMERGSSPVQRIRVWCQHSPPACPDGSIPIWLNALQKDLAAYLTWTDSSPNFDMWEVLLRDHRVHAHNCFFLLHARGGDNGTHFITLKQVIEELKPSNMGTLLAHVNRSEGSSYLSATRTFLSRFLPVGHRPESSLMAKVAEYAPYHIGEKREMEVAAIVCDDIQVERCAYRIF